MSKIEIKDLTFAYGEQNIFEQANVQLDDHWKLGLVGRNGRGKTTLLKILRGGLKTQAKINVQIDFTYFPQLVEHPADLTIDVLQALTTAEMWQIEKELHMLQVDVDAVLWRPFSSLSGGEQTKCLLALLFANKGTFALIDEPTNHLDQVSRRIVADYLQRKDAYIVVSHDRAFLNQVTDHILAIEKTQLRLYQGNYATYADEKEQRDQYEINQNQKLQGEIKRLKQTAQDKERWSNTRESDKYGDRHIKGSGAIGDTGFIGARSARVMKKAKNLEKRMQKGIEEKSQLLQDLEQASDLNINFQPEHHRTLLHVEQFSLGFENLLFDKLDFDLNRGKIVALSGANGSGKSTLFKRLLGVTDSQSVGILTMPERLKISVVRQQPDNTGYLNDFAEDQHLDLSAFLNNFRKLGLERNVLSQPIETMSQGQQKEVELARSLTEPANLYLWDESLNYLDTFNQEQLMALLKRAQPSMLLIEHDQAFITAVTKKLITLKLPR